ncbi:MAG: hypothetical protein JSV64_04345 [Candidatus Bathyarchaeota archaeon]|nr:MAG: hypothetical protein JSV64_04345 [Candidatus Bathyarchaeota archaeon]
MKRIIALEAVFMMLMAALIFPSFAAFSPTDAQRPAFSIGIVSPENRTYISESVPANLSLEVQHSLPRTEFLSWIGYSIDGAENVTVEGNTTIPITSYGSHSITVYATDVNGTDYASDTLHFTLTIPGDFNGNGQVDIPDVVLAAMAFEATPSDPNWNPDVDLAPVFGRIDIFDLATLVSYYGNSA